MIRAQKVARNIQKKPWRRPRSMAPRVSERFLSTKQFSALALHQLAPNPIEYSEMLVKNCSEISELGQTNELEKREAVKYLTTSLLRSQLFLPATPPAAPPAPAATKLDTAENPDLHELRLLLEFQQWMRYFESKSQETTEEQAAEQNVSSSEEASQATAGAPLDHAANMTQPREGRLARKERTRQVPTFFNRPHAQPQCHVGIYAAIEERDHVKAMKLYNLALREKQELDVHLIHSLYFFLTSHQQPLAAHSILRHYEKIIPTDSTTGLRASLCERMCDCMRHMDPVKHDYNKIQHVTKTIVHQVLGLDREGQQRCVPVLVSALIMQRATRVGFYARKLYQHMIDTDLTIHDGYWEHLLSASKYNRQDDLPFADIMQRSVASGWRSNPVTVLHALENMYPFSNINDTCVAVRAIVDLQQQESEDKQQYIIDLATLEALSATASLTMNLDMIMLVWEIVDVFNYEPSLALYENTIVCFGSHQQTYPNVFIVMSEMEAKGMNVSRALIRGVSAKLRDSLENVDLALGHIQSAYQDGSPISTNQLNCVMSAMAERGDVHCVSFIMEEFKRFELEMNADSYSFALEALGKRLYRVHKKDTPSDGVVRDCLEKASEYLSLLEDAEIVPTAHIIREYVELLCQANEVDTATEVVLEALENGGTVNNKTVYKVAMAQADLQNFDAARSIANHLSETLPELTHNINRKEFFKSKDFVEDEYINDR